MFQWLGKIIIILSILGLGASTLDAGISETKSFTLSVTVPDHSQLPSYPINMQQPSRNTINETHHQQIQQDYRDNQLVYLVSYVVD